MIRKVLVVEDDRAVREALGQTLELAELEPVLSGSFVAAKDRITAAFEGVILSDIRMPGRDGFHLLAYAQEQDPDLPVVLLTGEGDIPMAVKAMSQGAFNFLEKPCAPADLLSVLRKALHARELVLENRRLRHELAAGSPLAQIVYDAKFDTGHSELGLGDHMARAERALLVQALERSRGKASDAAQSLKLPRKTFYDKLARHNIRPEDFRPT